MSIPGNPGKFLGTIIIMDTIFPSCTVSSEKGCACAGRVEGLAKRAYVLASKLLMKVVKTAPVNVKNSK